MHPTRVFLLSPAHCGGIRAGYLLNDAATFELARKIRTPQGATLGEVFSFLSGLYFRGKVAYARAFAASPDGLAGSLVITTNRGLVPADTYITVADLRDMGGVGIECDDPRYRRPLERDARALAARGDVDQVVLLGSVATGKYVDVLLEALGDRLLFPSEFVGRGDMSRGGLMLRCAREDRELAYVPVAGAIRHGKRPPKLGTPDPAGSRELSRRSAASTPETNRARRPRQGKPPGRRAPTSG
jgi:hypothetical protein